jgi:hypothetical protein
MPLVPFALYPDTINKWQRYLQECIVIADQVKEYTVSTLPPVGGTRRLAFVTNEAGGYTLAFSDGTNWRRVQDRAIVS